MAADVPHRVTTAFEWTERAFELVRAREIAVRTVVSDGVVSAVLAGPCPRCGHHLVDRQVGSAVTEVRAAGAAVGPRVMVLDISCGCGQPHDGAPDHVTGCGVAFRVQLTLDEERA
ncbi:hypothetical protein [Actinokineospora enzanensis]|uniref:hypothetical protein n=1 Tax=Actinokineospora enzanensis TaxID=155975 RepID=UPI0003733D88|nr:hypothetical protein [Actinokineospora enzanensis]